MPPRPLLTLCACLLLAACAGGGRGEPPVAPAVMTGFAEGMTDVVEVEVTTERPVEAAELVGPDGRTYPAYQILRDRVVQEEGGSLFPNVGVGIGVVGGSSSRIGTSVGIGLPLGGFDRADKQQVSSRARIRIEDVAAYRAAWQDWTVRLRFDEPAADGRVMEVPAPPPPPPTE